MAESRDITGAAISAGDHVFLLYYGQVLSIDSIVDDVIQVTRPDGKVLAVRDSTTLQIGASPAIGGWLVVDPSISVV